MPDRIPANAARTHWLALVVAAALALPAAATEKDDLESLRATTLGLIQTLVDQGWITREKADELVRQAARKPPAAGQTEETVKSGDEEKVVRVPYVPEMVRKEIYDKVKEDVLAQAKSERWGEPGALPDWVGRLKLSGDLRMRYEHDKPASDNAPYQTFWSVGQLVNNTTEDRDRLRLRGRMALDAAISDTWSGGMRVATCRQNDPLCIDASAQTGGNRSEIRLDRAFLTFATADKTVRVDVGRFANPFLATDLVWNSLLGFDGVAGTYKQHWNDNLTQFFSAGIFPLQDIERSSTVSASSKWLYGTQTGVDWRLTDQHSVRLGLGLYDFRHIESRLNPSGSAAYNAGAPTFRQKGNTVFYIDGLNTVAQQNVDPSTQPWGIASKFRVLNLTAIGDIAVYDPIHVTLYGDYAKNIGFDQADILARTGRAVDNKTTAWQLRAQVGYPTISKAGDWQAYFAYKYVEADAVVDAFTDSDFRGGGTDAKGYIVGGSYGLDNNIWLTLKYTSAQPATPFNPNPPYSLDMLQVDLNARF